MTNGFVDIIFSAIARQEGEFGSDPNAKPLRQNNPLDLRFAGQIGASMPQGTTVVAGVWPIAQFDTLAHGIAAGYRQLWLNIARGMTLRQVITGWAPPNENNTQEYLANVQAWTKIPDLDMPLLNYLRLEPPPQ